ncbi:MAG: HD domain-containing protein, partial [Spirochaetales bacterium]|nr:HD domain-containing protein [Spirochaetales bacterium]
VFLENAFTVFQNREEISVVNFSETVKEMIAELRENRRFMLSIDDSISPAKTYIVTHSVKTAILALAVADYLKFPPFKQIDLGTAALLHVIGMLKIPESIYLSDKQLSPQERKALAAHPVLGFRILKAASFPIAVSQAVLEHNERLDGSGFPRRLVGEKTSQYGKILAVASSYNAAISKRPYKSGVDGHSGIMDLVKDAGKRYDEKALAALVYVLSLYPIGTYIIMSNGSLGMVVKPNPEDPKHPVVKLLVDENGNSYPNPPLVHTREGDEVVISRPLKKEEMAKLKKK